MQSYLKQTAKLIACLLLIAIAVNNTGCKANKCDCPTFGGHRLKHG